MQQAAKLANMKQLLSNIILIAIIVSGLSAGLSLSHVLEIPGKHRLTQMEFVHVQHNFYGGYAIFGAIAWVFCSVAGLIAGFAFYKINKSLAVYYFIASGGFIICLIIFAFFLNKYNQMIASWSTIIPADWETIRNHWELCHTVVFVISAVSFIAFTLAYGVIKSNRFFHIKNIKTSSVVINPLN